MDEAKHTTTNDSDQIADLIVAEPTELVPQLPTDVGSSVQVAQDLTTIEDSNIVQMHDEHAELDGAVNQSVEVAEPADLTEAHNNLHTNATEEEMSGGLNNNNSSSSSSSSDSDSDSDSSESSVEEGEVDARIALVDGDDEDDTNNGPIRSAHEVVCFFPIELLSLFHVAPRPQMIFFLNF
jgi:hypothetical protein